MVCFSFFSHSFRLLSYSFVPLSCSLYYFFFLSLPLLILSLPPFPRVFSPSSFLSPSSPSVTPSPLSISFLSPTHFLLYLFLSLIPFFLPPLSSLLPSLPFLPSHTTLPFVLLSPIFSFFPSSFFPSLTSLLPSSHSLHLSYTSSSSSFPLFLSPSFRHSLLTSLTPFPPPPSFPHSLLLSFFSLPPPLPHALLTSLPLLPFPPFPPSFPHSLYLSSHSSSFSHSLLTSLTFSFPSLPPFPPLPSFLHSLYFSSPSSSPFSHSLLLSLTPSFPPLPPVAPSLPSSLPPSSPSTHSLPVFSLHLQSAELYCDVTCVSCMREISML